VAPGAAAGRGDRLRGGSPDVGVPARREDPEPVLAAGRQAKYGERAALSIGAEAALLPWAPNPT
jgi:hypothetical protein